SAELWYMFGTLSRCWRPMTEKDFALSREMVTAWTNFMKTGQPGGGWKSCTAEDPAVKVFE
ncbi:MAG: carboxylesterase family protein, partial [Parasporobacterium sp.]|nr:carboxylesterase family protein [Parasporobacterium sp.]